MATAFKKAEFQPLPLSWVLFFSHLSVILEPQAVLVFCGWGDTAMKEGDVPGLHHPPLSVPLTPIPGD